MSVTVRESGVVVSEIENPSLAIGAGTVNVTGIVGTASATVEVDNAEVTKGAFNGTDTIPNTTVSNVASVLGVGSSPGFFDFVAGVDYNIVNNTIVWIGQQPSTAALYYVSYKLVKDATYYTPKTLFSIDDVRAIYGAELNNGVISEITLAALLTFESGGDGTIVVTCQAVDGQTSSYIDALTQLEREEVDTLIVTGVTNTQVRSAVINHVQAMSTDFNQKERHAWIAPANLNDTVQTIGTLADGINSDRVNMVAPPSVGITLKDVGTTTDARLVVSSVYAGAALAGIETANDAATPLLRKRLPSRLDVNSYKYIRSEILFMLRSGVTILQQDSNGVYVKEASTTDTSSIERVEPSVRRIKDLLRKVVRDTLNTRYIGTKLLTGSLSNIQASVQAILSNFISSTLITAFRNISAKLDSVDPRQVNVSFEIAPVFPLRFVNVSFSIFVNSAL
jgi:hypothetical protein